jgi:hypothetical protein
MSLRLRWVYGASVHFHEAEVHYALTGMGSVCSSSPSETPLNPQER